MQNDLASCDLARCCGPFSIISLVGLNSDSGPARAAALNYLAKTLQVPLAITSIGRGAAQIAVKKGTVTATAAGVLNKCTFTKRILHTTGIETPLGEVIAAEALSDGHAVLAGPSINSQVSGICEFFINELGLGKVIVDGAGDRRTFAAGADAAILCAGFGTNLGVSEASANIVFFERLMNLPNINQIGSGSADIRHINGALTKEILEDVKSGTVVIKDASNVFAGAPVLDGFFNRGGRLYVENSSNLAAIALNQYELFSAVKERVFTPVCFLE